MGMRPIRHRSPGALWIGLTRDSTAISSRDSRFAGHSSRTVRKGRIVGSGRASRVPNPAVWRTAHRLSPLLPCTIPHFSRGRCGVSWAVANRNFHVHLVSDSTGETVSSVARACLVQYEGIFVQEHVWSLVRTQGPDGQGHAGGRARPRPRALYAGRSGAARPGARPLPAPAAALRRRARPGDERAGRPFPFQERAVARAASISSTKAISTASTPCTTRWRMTTGSRRTISRMPT